MKQKKKISSLVQISGNEFIKTNISKWMINVQWKIAQQYKICMIHWILHWSLVNPFWELFSMTGVIS